MIFFSKGNALSLTTYKLKIWLIRYFKRVVDCIRTSTGNSNHWHLVVKFSIKIVLLSCKLKNTLSVLKINSPFKPVICLICWTACEAVIVCWLQLRTTEQEFWALTVLSRLIWCTCKVDKKKTSFLIRLSDKRPTKLQKQDRSNNKLKLLFILISKEIDSLGKKFTNFWIVSGIDHESVFTNSQQLL